MVGNGVDNAGNPNVDSVVYRWNGTALVQAQRLATIGASALEIYTMEGTLYLAVASFTDTRYVHICYTNSVILWSNVSLAVHITL